ncbi:MAG: hypothetical protein AB1485_03525 [Candidatus Thermoplasmatota archaeon]
MVRKVINLILTPLCFLAIIIYGIFLVIAVGFALVSSAIVLPYLSTYQWVFFVLIPIPIGIFPVEGPLLMLYYAFVIFVILFSFIWLVKSKKRADNFITLAQVFLATLFFMHIYYWLLTVFGISYEVPHFEEWRFEKYIFSITNACFHEELVARVLLLGLPLLFVHAIIGRAKRVGNYLLGGNLEVDGAATFFLILSSLIFACAHFLLGWDIYKILPTFVAGLALGYLFLKFGLYLSILLHLSFNYLGVVLGALGSLAPLIVTIIRSFLLFIGFVYFLKWLRKGTKFYLKI